MTDYSCPVTGTLDRIVSVRSMFAENLLGGLGALYKEAGSRPT
jgi:hypothetical protein